MCFSRADAYLLILVLILKPGLYSRGDQLKKTSHSLSLYVVNSHAWRNARFRSLIFDLHKKYRIFYRISPTSVNRNELSEVETTMIYGTPIKRI